MIYDVVDKSCVRCRRSFRITIAEEAAYQRRNMPVPCPKCGSPQPQVITCADDDDPTRLIEQRTAQAQRLTAMVRATCELERTRLEIQVKTRQTQLELRRFDAEELRLEDDIQQRLALRKARLHTEALGEASKQAQLLTAMQPPAKPKTQAELVIEERNRTRTRARAKQSVVSDFLAEIERIYGRHISQSEKAMRIRAVVEAYRQDPDHLPVHIRKFLEQVEDEIDD